MFFIFWQNELAQIIFSSSLSAISRQTKLEENGRGHSTEDSILASEFNWPGFNSGLIDSRGLMTLIEPIKGQGLGQTDFKKHTYKL